MDESRIYNMNITHQEPLICDTHKFSIINGKEKSCIETRIQQNTAAESENYETKILAIPLLKQILLVSGIFLQKMGCGAAIGYTAILLPALMDSDSAIQMSKDTASWLVSLIAVGILFSTLIFPLTMKKVGRKPTEQIGALIMAFSWILFGTANNITTLMIARFVQGLSHGAQLIVGSVMISECTSPVYRGFFLSTLSLAVSLGKLFAHLVGTITDWKVTAFACSGLSITSFIIIYLIPESPNWLASKGRYKDSIKSFTWFRGTRIAAYNEMGLFIEYKKASSEIGFKKTSNFFLKSMEIVKNKLIQKSFLTIFLLAAACTSSTSDLFATYTINILNELIEDKTKVYWIMNSIDFVRIISSIAGIIAIKRYDRRKVYFTSGILTLSFLLVFSAYAYLTFINYITQLSLLMILIIYCLIFSLSLGIFPLIFVYAGELFPLAYKELCGFSLTFSIFFTFFISSKVAMSLLINFHVHGTFAIHAACLSTCLIILYFILPETKDKTLVEIDS